MTQGYKMSAQKQTLAPDQNKISSCESGDEAKEIMHNIYNIYTYTHMYIYISF